MHTISWSGLARECAYAGRDDIPRNDTGSREADVGTDFHALFEAWCCGQPMPETPHVSAGERAEFLEALATVGVNDRRLRDAITDAEASWCERPAALDARTGAARWLELTERRGYREAKLAPHEVPGTFDLLVNGELPIVVELKTGRQEFLDTSQENAQLRAQCAAAISLCKAFTHADEGPEVLGVILHWTGERFIAHRHEYHSTELRPWLKYGIAPRLEKAATRRAVPEVGDGCQYCPAAQHCPGLGAAIMPEEPFDALDGLVRLRVAKQACDVLEERLRATAKASGGVPDGKGKVWGPAPKVTRTLDADAARQVLLGVDSLLAASATTITLASLDAALATHTKEVQMGVAARLAAAGAMATKESEEFRWRKAK